MPAKLLQIHNSKIVKQNKSKNLEISFQALYYSYTLEIKPCGLGSRIRDVEAF